MRGDLGVTGADAVLEAWRIGILRLLVVGGSVGWFVIFLWAIDLSRPVARVGVVAALFILPLALALLLAS